jgi:hypothetical protein
MLEPIEINSTATGGDMRHWILLSIATTTMLVPTNLYAQVEAGQTSKPGPTKPTEKATPCPPSSRNHEMPVTRSVLAQRYNPGQSLIVRLNNRRERVGKMSEIHSDYFLLTSSNGAERIAYVDVADVRKWSPRWRIGKILMMPIKAPLYAAVYGGFYTLVGIGYALDWITGHR